MKSRITPEFQDQEGNQHLNLSPSIMSDQLSFPSRSWLHSTNHQCTEHLKYPQREAVGSFRTPFPDVQMIAAQLWL